MELLGIEALRKVVKRNTGDIMKNGSVLKVKETVEVEEEMLAGLLRRVLKSAVKYRGTAAAKAAGKRILSRLK